MAPAVSVMLGLGAYAGMAPMAVNPNRKIFVGSLPNNVTDAELRQEFGKYGTISDIHLNNKAVEENRQWCFITFDSPEQAQAAKTHADRVLKFPGSDRVCEVTLAKHQGMFGQDAIGGEGIVGVAVMPGPKKIFCGSLPQSCTIDDLKREFGRFGQVIDVHLNSKPCDPGKNWAFITFAAPDQALAAKDGTDKILSFPGSERACEVMMAKNQGKHGQDPMSTQPTPAAVSAYPGLAVAAGFPGMAAYGYPQMFPTMASPFGSTWRTYQTAAGLPYYHNHATGQTQWECPPDLQASMAGAGMAGAGACMAGVGACMAGAGAYGAIPVQYPALGFSPY